MKTQLAILLAFALFVFGCTQPSGPAEGTTPSAPAAPGEPSQPQGGEQPPAETQPPAEETPEEPAGTDLSTETCFALMATGMPVECTMTTTYQGQTTTTKFWMQGENNFRSESPGQGSDCSKMVMIHKDNKDYMGCEGQKWMETTCDWYMVTYDEATGEAPALEESGTMDYEAMLEDMEDMPTSECSCVPWVVDQSKFDTPGKVCDEDEFMNEFFESFNIEGYE